MSLNLRFIPISHSWAAIHPKPKGVIQFIAGAFFGTFGPMFFYRHLLKFLYEQGYTIILLPFNFTFNHYVESIFLIREQYNILPELIRIASQRNYHYEVYLDDKNFSWVGHSLGCKYIALLEGFSALPDSPDERKTFIQDLLKGSRSEKQIDQVVEQIESLIQDLEQKIDTMRQQVDQYVHQQVQINSVFIKGQESILLAPAITGTEAAIRPQWLAGFVDRLGLGVIPTPDETFNLIHKSGLFNLTGLVRFKSDDIAAETCDRFVNQLSKPPQDFRLALLGKHLRPLGIQLSHFVLNLENPIIESVERRNSTVENLVFQLFQALKKFKRNH
ncbi:MAG TPA: DUF1350 family protein [Crinalium sp.]|jgi:hypothetical protein